jgi:amylosucrase
VPFQDNPATGDCRISGTCASLCGLEQADPHAVARVLLLYSVVLSSGGIPLIYLGDELGALNDHGYLQDPGKAGDSRWVHRPPRNAAQFQQRLDGSTPTGQIHQGLRQLIALRQASPALAGGHLVGFRSKHPAVLGYTRGDQLLVLANFSEHPASVAAEVLQALPATALDLVSGQRMDLRQDLPLGPYQARWLQLR